MMRNFHTVLPDIAVSFDDKPSCTQAFAACINFFPCHLFVASRNNGTGISNLLISLSICRNAPYTHGKLFELFQPALINMAVINRMQNSQPGTVVAVRICPPLVLHLVALKICPFSKFHYPVFCHRGIPHEIASGSIILRVGNCCPQIADNPVPSFSPKFLPSSLNFCLRLLEIPSICRCATAIIQEKP